MAYVNTAPTAQLDDTYNSLYKYVKQYITSGNLKSRFDVFEREEVRQGYGIETNVILAATNLRKKQSNGDIPARAEEHGTYKAKVFTLISTEKYPAQFAVTIDENRLQQITGDEAKIKEYAAELTESLMQGWINEKNSAVTAGLEELLGYANAVVNIPLGTDEEKYALSVLTNLKAIVADIREGVTGTSYGNTEIGDSRIASESIVMVMSNSTSATLDTYGFAKVFDPDYLRTQNVMRVTSSRIPEGQILITDSRNVILHKRYEKTVRIPNSDGSENIFYNVDYFVDVAIGQADGTGADIVAFPLKVIKTTEA